MEVSTWVAMAILVLRWVRAIQSNNRHTQKPLYRIEHDLAATLQTCSLAIDPRCEKWYEAQRKLTQACIDAGFNPVRVMRSSDVKKIIAGRNSAGSYASFLYPGVTFVATLSCDGQPEIYLVRLVLGMGKVIETSSETGAVDQEMIFRLLAKYSENAERWVADEMEQNRILDFCKFPDAS